MQLLDILNIKMIGANRYDALVDTTRRAQMNRDIIEGNWKELKGTVKERWGKLTDDDLDMIAGKRDQLVGRLQKAYGYQKEEAESELENFEKDCKKACGPGCSH